MPVFHHGTPFAFETFDPALFATQGASNGHLGVWVSPDFELASAFGDNVLTLEIDEVRAYQMTCRQLKTLHDNTFGKSDEEARLMYREIADALVAQGYTMIDIVERDGSSPTRIILDPSSIRIHPSMKTAPMSL
jgi:hypothetical protein